LENSTATAQMPYPQEAYTQTAYAQPEHLQLAHTQPTHPQTGARTIRRKIGNTVYRVSVHFSGTSKENLEDKVLRLARNDAMSDIISITDFTKNNLTFVENCGTLCVPQTGRLLEGGSLS